MTISGWAWLSRYQNVSILDFIEAKDDGRGCKTCKAQVKLSSQTSKTNFLQAGCPACCPTNSVKELKDIKALKEQINCNDY